MLQLPWESAQHEQFFYDAIQKSGNADAYHQAIFYVLGCSPDARGNINSLFDFKEDSIHIEGLNAGWQTGGTRRLCRLAFNLWNGYTEPGQEQLSSPYELFDCGFQAYMMQGIKLRYPEYARNLTVKRIKPHDVER